MQSNLQHLELLPKTTLDVGGVSFTAFAGEPSFQPLEAVDLVLDGKVVGSGIVTSFSHNRISNVSEINFIVDSLIEDDGTIQADVIVDDTFLASPEAVFTLSQTRGDLSEPVEQHADEE